MMCTYLFQRHSDSSNTIINYIKTEEIYPMPIKRGQDLPNVIIERERKLLGEAYIKSALRG